MLTDKSLEILFQGMKLKEKNQHDLNYHFKEFTTSINTKISKIR